MVLDLPAPFALSLFLCFAHGAKTIDVATGAHLLMYAWFAGLVFG